jgi:single-strand DNA-binding protein
MPKEGEMNKALLIGRVGGEPRVRTTASGQQVASFRLATSERWAGEAHTEWHTVVCWNALAETCQQYLTTSRLVSVEGRLQTRRYTDDHAVERAVTEVVAQRVEFLGPRPERPNDEQSDEPEAIADEASEAPADEQPTDATPAAPVRRRRRAS